MERLKKRFMKLDRCAFQKCGGSGAILMDVAFYPPCSDGSGSIDREEFLQIPQIANNPLASRLIAIFDEESVLLM